MKITNYKLQVQSDYEEKIVLALLLGCAVFAGAAEISIADFLPDPGFEQKHEPNAQLNAPGVKEINGWSARPANVNAWTSLSYIDRGGKTTGDRAPAMEQPPFKFEANIGETRV